MRESASCVDVLNLIGEHFLAGHLQSDSRSPLVRHASGIREIFRRAPLHIDEAVSFAPTRSFFTVPDPSCKVQEVYCAPMFNGMIHLDRSIAERKEKAYADPRVSDGIRQSMEYWKSFDASSAMLAALDPSVKAVLAAEPYGAHFDFITNLWQGHATIDFPTLLQKGLRFYRERVAAKAGASPPEEGATGFYRGLGLILEGIDAFLERYVREVGQRAAAASGERRVRLQRMLVAFQRIRDRTPTSFYEALQLTHFFTAVDGFDNAGRLDQYLLPFYLRDLAEGSIDARTAEDWLLEVLTIWAGADFWNLSIGGQTEDGESAVNELSAIVLRARGRLSTPRPSLAARIPAHGGEALLEQSFQVLSEGLGQPALYNDELYVKRLKEIGVPPRDACEYAFGGCTETHIAGKSAIRDAFLDLASALQLLLDGRKVRFEAGRLSLEPFDVSSLSTFDSFLAAYKRQAETLIDCFVHHRNLAQRIVARLQPAMIRSLFIDDCIERGVSHSEGGARYNNGMISVYGIPNIANSLHAIRELVYGTPPVSWAELLSALRANFQGHETLRRRCLGLPKYGNDLEAVDACAREVSDHAFGYMQTHRLWNGGIYYGFVANGGWMHVDYGRRIAATPDGRLAGAPLASSMAPVAGTDTHGPTATIRSITRLDLSQAIGTPVVNLTFGRKLFTSEYLERFRALVLTYFGQGGMQLQISVTDREDLRRAMRDPDSHGSLLVRVSGYCARFVELPRDTQAEILERTVF